MRSCVRNTVAIASVRHTRVHFAVEYGAAVARSSRARSLQPLGDNVSQRDMPIGPLVSLSPVISIKEDKMSAHHGVNKGIGSSRA